MKSTSAGATFGLADGNIYYAVVSDESSFQLTLTQADAYAETNIIDLADVADTSGEVAHSLTPRLSRSYGGWDPADIVASNGDEIEFGRNHGLADGEAVIYTADDTSGNLIDGLTVGATYFIGATSATAFQLYESARDAEDGINSIKIGWSGASGERRAASGIILRRPSTGFMPKT